ncbi:co-chaperone GroES [Candidatus Saccharibacteria bacterium]|nr:co-chaperone GroES [Candidatus Saccharibacteria bacterium]
MSIKPLGDRVVATREKQLEKTASGIYLGEAKEKPAYALVESVGPDVKSVKKGDKIIFKDYVSTEVKVDKVDYLIMKEEDILATL